MPPLTAEEIAAMGNDSSTVATNEIDTLPSSDAVTADETDARSDAVTDDEDAEGSVTDPSFPPALLPGSAYDALVCRDCVLKIPLLMKYAGSEGVMMVIRDGEEDDWRVIGRPGKSRANDGKNGISVDTTDATVEAGEKRKREEDVNAALNGEKRPRLDSSREANCLAPLPNSYASSIFKILKSSGSEASVQGAGDIFLDEDFRLRWCRCEEV
jgi:E3 ubiquitin-protein ligase UBR7